MTMSELLKVLLLGDSIRGSYQALVTEILDGKAEVVGPAENGQFSLYTLSSLGRWINELGEPDIVHWNNGIHDCGHNPTRGPAQFSVGYSHTFEGAYAKGDLGNDHAHSPRQAVCRFRVVVAQRGDRPVQRGGAGVDGRQ